MFLSSVVTTGAHADRVPMRGVGTSESRAPGSARRVRAKNRPVLRATVRFDTCSLANATRHPAPQAVRPFPTRSDGKLHRSPWGNKRPSKAGQVRGAGNRRYQWPSTNSGRGTLPATRLLARWGSAPADDAAHARTRTDRAHGDARPPTSPPAGFPLGKGTAAERPAPLRPGRFPGKTAYSSGSHRPRSGAA
jgi:hypothetical protein